jgi:hypothetical protein
MGVVHIEAVDAQGRPVPNAVVRLGTETEARPLGDVSVPTGELRVNVTADNYEPGVQTVNVVQGGTAQVRVQMRRTGLTGADVARRRGAISTFGAAPLVRGDGAFDLMGGFGGFPLAFRATLGFMPHGLFAVDGGLTIRTSFTWYEFELRSRIGLRLADDTFAVGGEVRFYGALGTNQRNGVGATFQLNLSAHFSLAGDEAVAGESAQDRANRLGSFAITLSPGLDINSDGFTAASPPNLTVNGTTAYSLCENRSMGMNPTSGDCTLSATVRGYLAGTVEIGLGRHLNAFAGLQYYFPRPDTEHLGPNSSGSNTARRPVLTDFWDTAVQANIYGGVTYKF